MEQVWPYIIITAKSTAVYLFIIAAIRLFGKKELAQLSVVDLVFILLISNSVQNAMVGQDTSLPGGLVAALGLFITNFILKWLLRRFNKLDKVIQGEAIVLIHEGVALKKGMQTAMMTMNELERALREHGVVDIKEVSLAILEVDGNISVLTDNYRQKTVKHHKRPQLSHNP